MIAEAHDDMEDGHWLASQRATFSAWKEQLRVAVGACHSWNGSSWQRTTKPTPPSSIPPRTEPPVKIWKSAGGMEARERSLCWDDDILLPTGVMTVGVGGGVSHGGMKNCSQEGGVGAKTLGLRSN